MIKARERGCPKCGKPLGKPRNKGEYALVGKDRSIHGSNRIFVAKCDDHGEFFIEPQIGHHSTHSESQVRCRYSKAVRKAVREKLTVQQRKHFDASWNGRRLPSEQDLALWDELATGR
jgi:hypothetical protein